MKAGSRWFVVGLVALMLGAVACSSDSSDTEGTTDTETTEDATGATGATGAGAAVEATDFQFAPDTITVQENDVLTFTNASDSTAHTFTVDTTEIDVELEAGNSEAIDVEIQPGVYDFECRFHSQMTGTLTVE